MVRNRKPTMKNIPTQAAGIIPYYKHADGQYRFLLIQHAGGQHWSFPKGHKEDDEALIQTAIRETKEEIGLDVSEYIERNYIISDNYQFPGFQENDVIIKKSVVYFPCQLPNQPAIIPQQEEIMDYRWGTFTETKELVTHTQTKGMFERFGREFLV